MLRTGAKWPRIFGRNRSIGHRQKISRRRRRLLAESLEKRQLLAADYSITTLLDVDVAGVENDNEWSLREALAHHDANGPGTLKSVEFEQALFSSGPGAITLDAALGQLVVSSDIEIKGPGADQLAIDAQGNSRVLRVDSTANAKISALSITGGISTAHGGGILLDGGALELAEVRVHDNVAGASASGGGIRNENGELTLIGSTVINNGAYVGAGLSTYGGDTLLTTSLIAENITTVSSTGSLGGGVSIAGSGSSFTFTAVNTTITGNQAGDGGGVSVAGTMPVDLINVTITDNESTYAGSAGGIVTLDTDSDDGRNVTLHNSILAENASPSAEFANSRGPISSSSSHNIAGPGSDAFAAVKGNQVNVADVGLLPLNDFGGPTQTHALADGSVAIDAGDAPLLSGYATDQRGYDRIVDILAVGADADGSIDVGAFEKNDARHVFSTTASTVGRNGTRTLTLGDVHLQGFENRSDIGIVVTSVSGGTIRVDGLEAGTGQRIDAPSVANGLVTWTRFASEGTATGSFTYDWMIDDSVIEPGLTHQILALPESSVNRESGLLEDTFTSATEAQANFGQTDLLRVQAGSYETYLRIDLSGYDLAEAASYDLKLAAISGGAPGSGVPQSVYFLNDPDASWSEGQLSWGNAPASGSQWTDFIARVGQISTLDITAAVEQALTAGNPSLTLLIRGGADLVDYASSEHADAAKRPVVVSRTPLATPFVSSTKTLVGAADEVILQPADVGLGGFEQTNDIFVRYTRPYFGELRLDGVLVAPGTQLSAELVATGRLSWQPSVLTLNDVSGFDYDLLAGSNLYATGLTYTLAKGSEANVGEKDIDIANSVIELQLDTASGPLRILGTVQADEFFTVDLSVANNTVSVVVNDALVASIPLSEFARTWETANMLKFAVSRLDDPGAEPLLWEGMVNSVSSYAFAVNPGVDSQHPSADEYESLVSLETQWRASPTDPALIEAVLDQRAKFALFDLIEEKNQAASALLGQRQGQEGAIVGLVYNGHKIVTEGDVDRVRPASTKLFTDPFISGFLQFGSQAVLSPLSAERLASRMEAIEHRVVGSFSGFVPFSMFRVLNEYELAGIPTYRLTATDDGQFKELNSGRIESSLEPFMSLFPGFSPNLESILTDPAFVGTIVHVPSQTITFGGKNEGGEFSGKFFAITGVKLNGLVGPTNVLYGTLTYNTVTSNTTGTSTRYYNGNDPGIWSVPPINAANITRLRGKATREDADLSLASAGGPLEVRRHYDSESEIDYGFGPGWYHKLGMHLSPTATDGSFELNAGTSLPERFVVDEVNGATTTYLSEKSDGASATKTVESGVETIVVTTRFGDVNIFEGATGESKRLVELIDRSGNRLQLSYPSSGEIDVLDTTDPQQPTLRLSFTLDTNGHITSALTPEGLEWKYTYQTAADGTAQLATVAFPDDQLNEAPYYSYQYGTGPGELNRLTTASVAGRLDAEFSYLPDGRLGTETQAAAGESYYHYDDINRVSVEKNAVGGSVTTYFDEFDRPVTRFDLDQTETVVRWDSDTGRRSQRVRRDGPATFYEHNDQGLLVSEETDGVKTLYSYDPQSPRPNLVVKEATIGGVPQQIELLQATFGSDGNPVSTTTGGTRTVNRTYDDRGLLESETIERPAEGGGTELATIWFAYDSRGRLSRRYTATTQSGFDTSRPHETFIYDDRDRLIESVDATGVKLLLQYDDVERSLRTYQVPKDELLDLDRHHVSFVQFDREGRPIATVDRAGNGHQYTYDASGRLERTQFPDGSEKIVSYGPSGRLVSVESSGAILSRYWYDQAGRLIQVQRADQTTQSFGYDAAGQRNLAVDEAGRRTVSRFDNLGLLTEVVSPTGAITSHTYDAYGRPKSIEPSIGPTVFFEFDQSGLLKRKQTGDQLVELLSYNNDGRISSITAVDIAGLDPSSLPGDLTTLAPERVRTWTTLYDAAGRPSAYLDPLQDLSKLEYDEAGNLTKQIDPLGQATEFQYDLSQDIVDVVLPAGDSSSPELRTILRTATSSFGAYRHTLTGTHDVSSTDGLLLTSTAHVDPTEQFSAMFASDTRILVDNDYSSLMSFRVDGPDRLTTTVRDATGRVLSTTLASIDDTEAEERRTTYFYDAAGELDGWVDPLGGSTTLVRNALGQVTETLSPELVSGDSLSRLSYKTNYDVAGNVVSRVDPMNREITYEYDASGRLKKVSYPDPDGMSSPLPAPFFEFTYNGFGEIVAQTDHLGGVTTLSYDRLGRLISKTLPDPDGTGPLPAPTTQWQYDANGNVTAMIDAAGRTTLWQYDAAGRVTAEHLPDLDPVDGVPAPQVTYEYGPHGNLTSRTDVLGNVTSFQYDELGREIRRELPPPTPGQPHPVVTRGYDGAGNVAWLTDPLGATTTFTYDVAGQLLSVTSADPDPGDSLPAPERSFSYDAGGNLVSFTDESGAVTSYTYDALSRPVSQTLSDPDGNGPLTAFTTNWIYDSVGNVLRQEDSLGRVHSFVYDSLNRETLRLLPDPDPSASGNVPSIQTTYDDAGNVASVTDPLGNTTNYHYDQLGRLINVVQPFVSGGQPSTTYTHDVGGNVATVTDALGRLTSYGYDGWGRLVSMTLPDPDPSDGVGPPTENWQYDDAGNLIAQTDPLGRETTYVYDDLGRLVETSYPDPDLSDALPAPSSFTEYDAAGRVTAEVDTLGRRTEYDYDSLGRLITRREPSIDPGVVTASVTQFQYDNSGNLVETMDALGRSTVYLYDDWGREVKRTLPDPDAAGPLLAPFVATTYDAAGNVAQTSDQLQRQTVYVYDGLDRVVETILPDPDSTDAIAAPTYTTSYDNAGNVLSEADPLGRLTQYSYDALGRLASQTQPDPDPNDGVAAPQTTYTYDRVGNLTAVTDPLGRTTTWQFDALDRVVSEQGPDPDGAGPELAPTTTSSYDLVGNLTSVAVLAGPGLQLTTTNTYDRWNRVVATTSPTGDTTSYAYDLQNNQTSLTDASGNTTSYLYDALNRLVEETNALGDSRIYEYDRIGSITAMVDRNGRRTEWTYDDLDRVVSEAWLDGGATVETIMTSYDDAGQVASISSAALTDHYQYDDLDQVIGHDRSGSGLTPPASFAYSYDAAGGLESITQTIGADTVTTDYVPDAAGRLREIHQSGTSVTQKRAEYIRDASGQVTQLVRYSGLTSTDPALTTDYTYDDAGRRTDIVHRDGSTMLASYGMTFDSASRTTSIDSLTDGLLVLTLDESGRLVATVQTAIADESFSYDATGNRTGTDIVTGTNNQLLSDGTYAYQYDEEGNRTRRTLLVGGQPSGAFTTYTYDHRNRLTAVEEFDASGVPISGVEYSYDHADQRISRVVDHDGDGTAEITQRFVVDGDTVTAVLDAAGNPTHHYLHGAAIDEVLADEVVGGDVVWTLADDQKTIRDLAVEQSGSTAVANHRIYDSFGNLVSQTNAAVDHLFGFTGREHDSATGLEYFRARWYDGSVGKFLSEDPLGFAGGDTNLSAYVGNSPYDYTDPSGMSWLSKFIDILKEGVEGSSKEAKHAALDASINQPPPGIGDSTRFDNQDVGSSGVGSSSGEETSDTGADEGSMSHAIRLDDDFVFSQQSAPNWSSTGQGAYFVGHLLGRAFSGSGEWSDEFSLAASPTGLDGQSGASSRDHVVPPASWAQSSGGDADWFSQAPLRQEKLQLFQIAAGHPGVRGEEINAIQNRLQADSNRYYAGLGGDNIPGFAQSNQDPIGFAAGGANLYRYVENGPTNATDPSGLIEPTIVRGGIAIAAHGVNNSSTSQPMGFSLSEFYPSRHRSTADRANFQHNYVGPSDPSTLNETTHFGLNRGGIFRVNSYEELEPLMDHTAFAGDPAAMAMYGQLLDGPGYGNVAVTAKPYMRWKQEQTITSINQWLPVSGGIGEIHAGAVEGNNLRAGIGMLTIGVDVASPGVANKIIGRFGDDAVRAVSPKGSQTTQLYSYFDGAVDTTRPFTSSSGRVYLSSHAPGAWLTERGAIASARRFIRTGRISPYSSTDNFFTTGPINPAEWGLKPVLPRTANFWKRLGGQYHTSIGTSGFELASPGSRLLTNSPIPSTSSQIWQARRGFVFESTADVLVIGNGIYWGNETFGGSDD